MFWLELLVVLAALALGARLGGIFLGIAGGLGLAFLVFVFGLAPSAPPIDVMLIITAVIVAASVLQVAGGMDYLVSVAEKILRSNPKYITFLAPMVCYLFTFMAGTGNIAFALLPVIAEVARETGVRPERPMSISVVASQQAITASCSGCSSQPARRRHGSDHAGLRPRHAHRLLPRRAFRLQAWR